MLEEGITVSASVQILGTRLDSFGRPTGTLRLVLGYREQEQTTQRKILEIACAKAFFIQTLLNTLMRSRLPGAFLYYLVGSLKSPRQTVAGMGIRKLSQIHSIQP